MIAFTVSAPASSANLGAGFDAVAVALELRMTAHVRELAPGAAATWRNSGAHAPTHDGLRGCVERAIARPFAVATPMRTPVNDPGPTQTAIELTADNLRSTDASARCTHGKSPSSA